MILQETTTLSNGVEIPRLALGTWMIPDDEVGEAVQHALKLGYRHIDTAQAYENEAGVANGIRNSDLPREQVFVTTKLAAEAKTYDDAAKAIDGSLSKMGLDTIDLLLIHSPQPWKAFGGEDRFEEGNREAWRAMEDALEAGKLRAIGVSNFEKPDLENLLGSCRVKPMVNQVLAHIRNTPTALIDFCRQHDMVVEAYSPMAHGELMKSDTVAEIARQYGVSVPQLAIRYTLQLGLIPLPKTSNPEHMKSNADVDFEISDADMATLSNLPPMEDYGEASGFPVYGGSLD